MNPDAQVYLADQLALIRDGSPRRDERTPEEKQRAFSSFTSALQALKAVGAVEESEIHDWSNRCLEALGKEPLEPIALRPGRAVMRSVSFRDEPRLEFVPPPLPEFVRLVPASTPAQATRHGGRFQVLGVEIYDTELAVARRLAPLSSEESISAELLNELDVDTEGLPDDTREVMRHGSYKGGGCTSRSAKSATTSVRITGTWVVGVVAARPSESAGHDSRRPLPVPPPASTSGGRT